MPSAPFAYATSIAEVLTRMRAIDAALPQTDGVSRFNRLYLRVTENIAAKLGTAYFGDDAYIARMDVVFANYYFDALAKSDAGAIDAPRCWAPLFEARARAGIPPLTFALAGMNAHINHDLARTVFDLAFESGRGPERGSAEHGDYLRVNDVLGATMDAVKPELFEGEPLIAEVDAKLGREGDAAELFSLTQAREAAFSGGEAFWAMRGAPAIVDAYDASLDRFVGMASRAMLAIRP